MILLWIILRVKENLTACAPAAEFPPSPLDFSHMLCYDVIIKMTFGVFEYEL